MNYSSNVFSMRPGSGVNPYAYFDPRWLARRDRRCVGCSILLLDRTNPDDLCQQCSAGHTAATLIAEALAELRKVRP